MYSIGALALIRLIYVILIPFLAPLIGKFGVRNSIMLGMSFLFASNIAIYFLNTSDFFLFIWIILVALCFSFYYLPLTIYTSKFTDSKARGTEMSLMYTGMILASAAAPYISGRVISIYSIEGFAVLLGTFIILGAFPLFKLKNYKFEYTGRITNLIKINRSLIRASWIESCHFATRAIGVFWVLYIFLFYGQNYSTFGIVLTVITLVSAIINIFVGKYLNQHNRKHALHVQSFLSPLSWVFRIGANSSIGILFADAFHNLNGYIRESTVETTAYDLINRGKHEQILDEKIVSREMIINLTIVIALVLGIILAVNFGIKASFTLGIIFSLGFLFV